MTRTSLLCVVALLLEACVASAPRQPTLTTEQLLAGDALPWDTSSAPPLVGEDEAFGLDDEMRAFAAPLMNVPDPAARLVGLRNAMLDGGLFSVEYADTFTRTARATFHERQGNCLSFTMLFVALARAVGLEVRYHVVDVPPTFNNDLGVVVVGTHVNAVIDASADRRYVIDFNAPNFREGYPSRAVSDRYAVALFYSNLGAEALSAGKYELSFASLRAALRAYDMPAIWVNLGVLYARQGLYEHAEAAQLHALEADPGEQSALVNLVSVYSSLGEKALPTSTGSASVATRDQPLLSLRGRTDCVRRETLQRGPARGAQRDPPEGRRGRVLLASGPRPDRARPAGPRGHELRARKGAGGAATLSANISLGPCGGGGCSLERRSCVASRSY